MSNTSHGIGGGCDGLQASQADPRPIRDISSLAWYLGPSREIKIPEVIAAMCSVVLIGRHSVFVTLRFKEELTVSGRNRHNLCHQLLII